GIEGVEPDDALEANPRPLGPGVTEERVVEGEAAAEVEERLDPVHVLGLDAGPSALAIDRALPLPHRVAGVHAPVGSPRGGWSRPRGLRGSLYGWNLGWKRRRGRALILGERRRRDEEQQHRGRAHHVEPPAGRGPRLESRVQVREGGAPGAR